MSILLLGTLLRLYRLGAWDLGLDEGYSGHVAAKSVGAIWAFIARDDFHPPLSYIMLHFWRSAGNSEFTLRLLPVFFGTLSILMVYRIGAYLLDRRAGLVASLLLAISPLHIWHSQEVRMYAPVVLLSLISLDALARLIREDRPLQWCTYVGAMTLGLYTDYGALLVLAAHNIVVAVLTFLKRGPALWKWGLAQVIIVTLYVPWVPVLLASIGPVAEEKQAEGLTPAGPRDVIFVLAQFTSAFTPMGRPLIKLAVVLLFGFVFVAGVVSLRRRPVPGLLLGVLAIAPIVVGAGLSYRTRVFFPRTLIEASAGYLLLLAQGFLALRRRHFGTLLLAVLVAVNAVSLDFLYYHTEKSAPWRRIADFVSSQIQPHEGIIFVAGDWHRVFDFYYHGPVQVDIDGYNRPADLGRIHTFIDGHRVVYFVSKQETSNDPTRQVRRYIQSQSTLSEHREFEGGVVVDRYTSSKGATY